ncbi:hypothetical protein DC366_04540 [Pelagivirga sediminicola]|uniref:Uncharacterized protein n=1 Tax=Pelagivirga sediminicola TaxID=2170575 RepID=A0A2T7G9G9_9RHOB|nr:F0F1 ATP synthase subunit gamma [Pelagivirga sediminicola]PVA11046.1 hypothetical protein DC366_04540 [Pelagivirga sediminicola]
MSTKVPLEILILCGMLHLPVFLQVGRINSISEDISKLCIRNFIILKSLHDDFADLFLLFQRVVVGKRSVGDYNRPDYPSPRWCHPQTGAALDFFKKRSLPREPSGAAFYARANRILLGGFRHACRCRTCTSTDTEWTSRGLPQFSVPAKDLLASLVRNLVFATLYRAAAEALVTENAARLARMQQAEQSVDENLEELKSETRPVRQSEITTELLDVIVGFEALKRRDRRRKRKDAASR